MRNSKSFMAACNAGTSVTARAVILSVAAAVSMLALSACVTKQVAPSTVPVVSFQLQPPSTIQAGGQASLVAVVTNDPKMMGIDWNASCVNTNCGSFNPAHTMSGQATTYTAPSSVPQGGVNLAARATALPAQTAVVNVSIFTNVQIKLTGFPASPLGAGNTTTLTAVVTGDPNNPPLGVGWSLSCTAASCGTLSALNTASGFPVTYTAPPTVTTSFTVTFQVTPLADTTQTITSMITVNPVSGVSVVISGLPGSIQAALTANIAATVSNDSAGGGVNWNASCTISGQCGTFTNPQHATGSNIFSITYNAPPTVPAAGLPVTITATSVDSPSVVATANTTVTSPTISISITAAPPSTMPVSTNATLSATVLNDNVNPPNGVDWTATCTGGTGTNPCGSFNPAHTLGGNPPPATIYTAPAAIPGGTPPGVVTIIATATATENPGPAKTAMATVTITAANSVSINWNTPALTPPSMLALGGNANMAATVANDPVTLPNGVTWMANCTPGAGAGTDPCGTFSNLTTANMLTTTYTAPTVLPLTPVTIVATAQALPNPTVSKMVTILPPTVTVVISTQPASVQVGGNAQLIATITNDTAPPAGVNWSVTCTGGTGTNPCGSFSPTNTASTIPTTYTAPTTAPTGGTVTITATYANPVISTASAMTNPIPVTANTTAGLLKGQYALSVSGQSPSGFFGVVGSIIADGNGNITGGEEDTAPCGPTNIMPVTGTYSVGSDGRGSMTLNTGNPCFGPSGTQTFSFAIVNGPGAPAPRALVSEFNSGGGTNGSGSLDLQDTTDIAKGLGSINGSYAFVFAGFDLVNSNPVTGLTITDVGGTITVGSGNLTIAEDVNDQGTGTVTSTSGTFTYTAPDTFGRSTATNTASGSSFAFYVVNAGEMKFLEVDGGNLVEIGPAYSQGTVAGSPYVYTFTGIDGTQSAFVVSGGFFASGLTSGLMDFNDNGLQTGASGAAFTASVTAPSGGRGTLTLTGTPTGVSKFAYYPTANNGILLLELDTGFTTAGALLPQSSSTFTDGNYATNFTNSGLVSVTQEEDAVGQIVVSSSSTLTGTVDVFNTSGNLNLLAPLTGSFLPTAPAGGGRYSGSFMITETPSNQTLNEIFYVAGPDTVLFIESDNQGQTSGLMLTQTLTP
jgi:hypothetical protein